MTASPQVALLLIRLGFGAFIALWGVSKILQPGAAQAIFDAHYGIGGLGIALAYGLGALQSLLGVAIMLGAARTVSYGLGLAVHGAGMIATLQHYLLPFAEGSNLVFWASVPILLGALGLFLARHDDTMFSIDARRRAGLRPSTA